MEYVAGLIMGSEKYEVCESFLHQNRMKSDELGEVVGFFPVREETRVINGKETTTLMARVQGARATKNVVFRLQKHKGEWEILYVALELAEGGQKKLYP